MLKESSGDLEMEEMAREEVSELKTSLVEQEEGLKLLLLPRDPLDGRNIMIEIRSGAGGDEASLWAADLLRMYQMYCSKKKWKSNVVSASGEGDGYRECILEVKGDKVWSELKYESGVHRVQRVPATESKGRVHTSTATVAIMPEVEEVDVNIDPKDVDLQTARCVVPQPLPRTPISYPRVFFFPRCPGGTPAGASRGCKSRTNFFLHQQVWGSRRTECEQGRDCRTPAPLAFRYTCILH